MRERDALEDQLKALARIEQDLEDNLTFIELGEAEGDSATVADAEVALKGLTLPVASRLFRLGLFWHFLDIAWVGIFSVVYLPGRL